MNKKTESEEKVDIAKRKDFDDVREILETLPALESPILEDFPTSTTKKKRGRPPGTTKKKEESVETIAKPEHLETLFNGINIFLEHFKLDPLSENEIKEGVQSWYPIYLELFPSIGGQSIYFAPIIWSGSVLIPRLNFSFIKPKSKDEEKQTEDNGNNKPDQPIISKPKKEDWSKSKPPG